ncbi:hypothetical protein Kpol_1054p40 [Vanderwaltozyma polyspora DSM 70294]|uniref:DNA-binding protein RAP1 n=1 Tax=Vanderwaltozyma polyspora (strain ATCC 22028 / DSM 70294 / BCRC 21397 / CBS 2163 / NBRC 10782 / NRRL Y-8283 / UCD 57-17) TaxID=436907 RepID=A7TIC7_VANPO|nr:uncharacterized protein Kpol_1054p40 [Vanderwaltozyma polyspora DSM 70294]EDO17993.1 hypothetical protein Kpol_1054p40 [Vanderwaltozyma polyspora DSM 70294]
MSSPDDFDTAPDEFVDVSDNIALPTDTTVDTTTDNTSNNAASIASDAGTETRRLNTNIRHDNSNSIAGIFQNLKFYINTEQDAYDTVNDIETLTRLIQSNGGTVLENIPQQNSIDFSKFFVISPYNDTKLRTVTSTFIKACCQNNTLLNIDNYLVPFDEFRSVIDSQLASQQQQEQDEDGQQQSEKQQHANQNLSQELGLSLSDPQSQNHPNIQTANPDSNAYGNDNSHTENSINSMPMPSQDQNANIHQNDNNNDNFDNSKTIIQQSSVPSHNKTSFTEEEDEFILDVVRKNPTRRTTHTLFDEISHYVPNHTGNSIRHRYRVYLSKRLEFVYQVDSSGKLVRDENGNLVKTKVLPPSIKKKFTAEDDYNLAMGIKKQFYRDLYQVDPDTGESLILEDDSPVAIAKRKMTMMPNHIPGTEPNFQEYKVNERRGPLAREFFKQFGEHYPSHTENAWRDRFRKFLLSYGIDNYITYYETEKENGNEPEPMKNFTTRPKRSALSAPGNYGSYVKKLKYNKLEENASAVAAAAAAVSPDMNSDNNNAHSYTIPESELLDEATMNFISSLKNDLSKIDNNIPFEYPQEIAEAIRNDFTNEEAEFDNIDPNSIPFPPEIASIDLFLPQFFRMASTSEFLAKVHEVISRDYEPSQAEKLVQDLCDEAGVRKTFSTSILTALSGDLMVFPRYFLNMFKHNVNPPMNVPGIWTREDDSMLKSNNEDDIKFLINKHGTGRIEMRRRFIEKDLI